MPALSLKSLAQGINTAKYKFNRCVCHVLAVVCQVFKCWFSAKICICHARDKLSRIFFQIVKAGII